MCKEFETTLAMHCSEALFGLKSANLINVKISDCPNIYKEIEDLNLTFNPKICFKILKSTPSYVLILVFQTEKLKKQIFNKENNKYLLSYNYPTNDSLNDYLDFLTKKINNDVLFPNEIGVFLGYSLDDIISFNKKESKCLYVGYWKVYSNLEQKMQLFNKYKKCREIVNSLLNKGYNLETFL